MSYLDFLDLFYFFDRGSGWVKSLPFSMLRLSWAWRAGCLSETDSEIVLELSRGQAGLALFVAFGGAGHLRPAHARPYRALHRYVGDLAVCAGLYSAVRRPAAVRLRSAVRLPWYRVHRG